MVKMCDVCGNALVLEKEHIYMVTENKGISSVLSPNEIYDATDCPKCGCQNILKRRLPFVDADFEEITEPEPPVEDEVAPELESEPDGGSC